MWGPRNGTERGRSSAATVVAGGRAGRVERSIRRPTIFSMSRKSGSSSRETNVIASPVDSARAVRPDAVDVVLGRHRHVEVHHVPEIGDVDPARGEVGRDEHAHFAALEVGQRAGALRLRAVAMDAFRGDVVLLERQR